MKKLPLLSLLLALLLLAALPAPEAFAQEDAGGIVLESYDGQTLEQTRLSEEEAAAVPALMAEVSYYNTLEDAALDVRAQLMAGEEAVVVGINQSYSEEKARAVFNLALAHTGNPKEGDYLANHCRGYSATIRISSTKFYVTYTPNYATTTEQEAQVDAKVAQILANVRRGDPYETVLDIHRYLRANVAYQGGETVNHTAYSAFILGYGVCESYSSAFYRLALECGIDCRIVTGLLIDGGHAWNIVELDGLYYIVDSTNDVFLRCPASVQGLLNIDSKFTGDAAFTAAYPIATEDYVAQLNYHYDPATATLTLLDSDAVENFYRDVTDLLLEQHVNGITNPNFKYSTAPWDGITEQIATVNLGGSPSFIPHRMFYWNQAIESVTIPASVETIYKNAFNSCLNLWDIYFTGTQAQWQAITVETYNNALGWAALHYNAAPVPTDQMHGCRYSQSVTAAPTCTAQGLKTYTCSCGSTYTEAISATGHSYEALVTAPTCTAQGYTTYTCGACGDSFADDYVAQTGHSETTVAGYAATCEASGLTDGVSCSVCSAVITAQEVIPATGHSYEALVTAPTCTAQGYTTYTCPCGDSYADDYVAQTGHSYEVLVTAPTCTAQGYTTYTCPCGDSYVDSFIAAAGHDYVSSVQAPTCDSDGLRTNICSNCGDTTTEVIPTNGHSYEDGACTACGAADPDYVSPEPPKQGLQKADDGNYYYYINGEIATDFTGLMENSAGRWYVLAGQVQMSYDGLMEYEGTKYLIKAGHVNTAFTGITKQEGVYYYFAAGVNDLEFEGLVVCNGMKAYVQDGEVNFNKTGIVEDNGQLLYVKYGIWRNTFKGLARTDDGNWIYMLGGTFDATYTGVAKLNATWVYVADGCVNFNYSGIVTVNGVNYTVKYGIVQLG